MYNNKKEPFIGLEVYLNETGKKPPKFEYQASSKTAYRDTFTKKKYFISQFGNWLNEKHVQEKFNQGCELKLGSVDVESDEMPKYGNATKQRKFIYYFVKNNYKRSFDGMKPISQSMPQYTPTQMTEAQPTAPENSQPVNYQDHKKIHELDDDLDF